MAHGDVTRFIVEVVDHSDGDEFFWATVLDKMGHVVAANPGKFPLDAATNAFLKARNREADRLRAESEGS